jgi:hypothetical protein
LNKEKGSDHYEEEQTQTQILQTGIIDNETSGPLNKSMLAQRIDKIKYNNQDDIKIIEGRIKRCIKQATKGRLKKADSALNPVLTLTLTLTLTLKGKVLKHKEI